MKKINIRICLFLLNKPLWQLGLHILMIILIRVFLLKTVLAEDYAESSSPELITQEYMKSQDNVFESKEEHNRHLKTVDERVVNDFKVRPIREYGNPYLEARTIYECANPDILIDGNASNEIQQPPYAQLLKAEDIYAALQSKYDSKMPPLPETLTDDSNIQQSSDQASNANSMLEVYVEIIDQFTEIVSEVESKRDLFEQALDFVRTIHPNAMWAQNAEELQSKAPLIQKHIDSLYDAVNRRDDSDLEYFKEACKGIYCAAIMSYNVCNVGNYFDNYEIIEKIFTQHLNAVLGEKATERFLYGLDNCEK